jgi:hypothetical protein
MGGEQTLGDIINTATEVTLLAVPFLLVLLLFVWSMGQLIVNLGDAEKKKQARSRIFWGIIVLFVVFSIPGLLAILWVTFFSDFAVSDFGQGWIRSP